MISRTGIAGRLGESYGILKERNFRYLFLGNICLGLAQWLQQIGIAWLVYELTGSAAQLGAITGAQGIVLLLTSPLGGVLSDRIQRRTLLMGTTAINAAQAIALATLVATGHIQVWHLYGFAVLGGMANAITQPVRQAFVYDAVGRENVARAVPVNNLAQSGTRVLGPAFAGMVVGFIGTSADFYSQGALALLALGLTSLIGTTRQTASRGVSESPFRTLAEGMRYVAGNPSLRGQIIIQMVPVLLVYPYVQFLAFFAARLHGGAQTYGILATGAGYGGVMGLFILTCIGEVKRKGTLLLLGVMMYPVSVVFFTFAPNFPVAMLFLILAGFCNSFYAAMQNTLVLLTAREDMRGRVMGLYTMVMGLGPIGQVAMGIAISQYGVAQAVRGFALAAIALLLVSFVTLKSVREA